MNYFLKNVVWSRQSEKRASKLTPNSKQNLGVVRIFFKKVVSFHFLIFRDGRRRTQHFHLKSREYCSSSVYKSFQNDMYVSHICCILKGIKKKCSVKRLIWTKQKYFWENHHSEVAFWLILTSNPPIDFSSVPYFLWYSTDKIVFERSYI